MNGPDGQPDMRLQTVVGHWAADAVIVVTLTRDSSTLAPHHLDKQIRVWGELDPITFEKNDL